MDDPHDLQRFVDAQSEDYERALAELKQGRKRSHWMWYMFPQVKGLGSSSMAEKYAIRSREEAQAYLAHPILGPRLRELTRAVNQLEGRTVDQVFGYPDNMKFRSSMTLFAQVSPGDEEFSKALARYFRGEPDALTIQRL